MNNLNIDTLVHIFTFFYDKNYESYLFIGRLGRVNKLFLEASRDNRIWMNFILKIESKNSILNYFPYKYAYGSCFKLFKGQMIKMYKITDYEKYDWKRFENLKKENRREISYLEERLENLKTQAELADKIMGFYELKRKRYNYYLNLEINKYKK